METIVVKYKIRAGSPMPSGMNEGQTVVTGYVLQTFGLETQTVHSDIAKGGSTLLGSSAFTGQGGPMSSAQYQQKAEVIAVQAPGGDGPVGDAVFQSVEAEWPVYDLPESDMIG